jgi:hypothetical protein
MKHAFKPLHWLALWGLALGAGLNAGAQSAPTAAPSAAPTAAPTAAPDAAPTDLVVEPTGPKVDVTLPETPMTNAPVEGAKAP